MISYSAQTNVIDNGLQRDVNSNQSTDPSLCQDKEVKYHIFTSVDLTFQYRLLGK